jgi:hypothetical protein
MKTQRGVQQCVNVGTLFLEVPHSRIIGQIGDYGR